MPIYIKIGVLALEFFDNNHRDELCVCVCVCVYVDIYIYVNNDKG